MRKFVGLAVAVLGLFGLAAVATAGEAGPSPQGQVQTLEATHSPSRASKRRRGVGTNVTITLTLKKADNTKPSPTVRAVVTLPRGIKLNYRRFPTCQQSRLESQGPRGCPSKSRVGSGSLRADASPVIAEVGGTVTAFNGANRTYLLYIVPEISSPLVIPGRLRGRTLDFTVPLVPTLPGQPNATLTYFQVKTGRARIRRGGRTYYYIENPTRCSRSGFAWKIAFTYENGETLAPTDSAPCRR